MMIRRPVAAARRSMIGPRLPADAPPHRLRDGSLAVSGGRSVIVRWMMARNNAESIVVAHDFHDGHSIGSTEIYCGHRPFGCQSLAIVIHGSVVSCRTKKTDRRVSVPTLLRAMGGPSGMIIVSPACATIVPSGVSRH
jgi:hypothetical protein